MRSIRFRIASLALVLAFQGVAAVDAFGLHACPHHDALPEAARHEAPPALHGGEGHDGATHASADAHAPAEDGHGDHGPCTCVGTCQVQPQSSAIASEAAAPSLAGHPVTRGEAEVVRREALPGRPSFLLPYAHGPPSNRSV